MSSRTLQVLVGVLLGIVGGGVGSSLRGEVPPAPAPTVAVVASSPAVRPPSSSVGELLRAACGARNALAQATDSLLTEAGVNSTAAALIPA